MSPNSADLRRKMSEALNNGQVPSDAKILSFKQKAPVAKEGKNFENLGREMYNIERKRVKMSGMSLGWKVGRQYGLVVAKFRGAPDQKPKFVSSISD